MICSGSESVSEHYDILFNPLTADIEQAEDTLHMLHQEVSKTITSVAGVLHKPEQAECEKRQCEQTTNQSSKQENVSQKDTETTICTGSVSTLLVRLQKFKPCLKLVEDQLKESVNAIQSILEENRTAQNHRTQAAEYAQDMETLYHTFQNIYPSEVQRTSTVTRFKPENVVTSTKATTAAAVVDEVQSQHWLMRQSMNNNEQQGLQGLHINTHEDHVEDSPSFKNMNAPAEFQIISDSLLSESAFHNFCDTATNGSDQDFEQAIVTLTKAIRYAKHIKGFKRNV